MCGKEGMYPYMIVPGCSVDKLTLGIKYTYRTSAILCNSGRPIVIRPQGRDGVIFPSSHNTNNNNNNKSIYIAPSFQVTLFKGAVTSK